MAGESPIGLASRALACSVGIMAHNEAANIATAIETILHQRLTVGHVAKLIVVASGCTDGTVPVVAAIARDDARVRLLVQQWREGKASAINLFLGGARSPLRTRYWITGRRRCLTRGGPLYQCYATARLLP